MQNGTPADPVCGRGGDLVHEQLHCLEHRCCQRRPLTLANTKPRTHAAAIRKASSSASASRHVARSALSYPATSSK
jgi:hypothetical protein